MSADTETLAEVLVRELTAEYGDEPEWTELGSIRRITRAIETHFAARIVQARAGEGGEAVAIAEVLDGTRVTANTWQSAARRLADENRQLRALTTADPS